MAQPAYNVLFLCTGNSARSIMAEAIFNRIGRGKFRAYSAGSHPPAEVNPHTLDVLIRRRHETGAFRAKDWHEFAGENAPVMGFIITVCDKAAGEACPLWPGQPVAAHWELADPATAGGNEDEVMLAFDDAYRNLANRLQAFINLPTERSDRDALQKQVRALGADTAQPARRGSAA